jgi:hypothetical protein
LVLNDLTDLNVQGINNHEGGWIAWSNPTRSQNGLDERKWASCWQSAATTCCPTTVISSASC